MPVYRGPGGAGDATNDATVTAVQAAATSAATSATNAANSATAAATSASGAATSATNAANSAITAAGQATTAANSATNAATFATNASLAADDAAESVLEAQGFASEAFDYKIDASLSAEAAEDSATDASNSATDAFNSATAAASSATNAAASFDAFDDRYLGSKASDPTLDNDGNALLTGALYFNSTVPVLKVYTGSEWINAPQGAAGVGVPVGGTTGQILAKINSTNYNTQWIDPAPDAVTSVTGTSPVVSSGGKTPAISLASGYGDTLNPYASKTANFILAAPNGSAGVPTFRAVVAADIPTLNQNTTGTASNVTGTVAIANGGTGATTNTAARTNLGATTLGANIFTVANPSAITFPRFNADNTISTLDAATFRTAIGAAVGTVTSVAATAGTGISVSGSPITSSGTLTITNTAPDQVVSLTGAGATNITGTYPNFTISTSTTGTGAIESKTASYTVVADDVSKIINCTANTFTVSLTAAATLGSGFAVTVWNTGTGVITIDPNSTETIDGDTTLVLQQNEGTQIVCDGTSWYTGSKKTMRGYAENIPTTDGKPVATGSGSISLGEAYSSGANSFAAVNNNNTGTYGAKSSNTLALGNLANASGSTSISFGFLNTSSGNESISIGVATTASGANSLCIGRTNTASAFYSCCIGGENNTASAFGAYALGNQAVANIKYKYVFSAGQFANNGDAQRGVFILRSDTTNNTPEALTADNSAASTDNQIILANNSAFAFHGTIVARQKASDGVSSAAWKIEGIARREGSANTTVLVSSVITVLDNAPSWGLTVSADTTNGGVKIEVTGATSTNIRWVGNINTSEVTYA